MDLNKIGKTIKQLRINKGMRQSDLAWKLNISDGAGKEVSVYPM